MSKNLFDRLSPLAASAVALFKNAGLDLVAMVAGGDANALKAHIEAAGNSAEVAKAITDATAKLQGDLDAAAAQVSLYTQALATAGIQLKASDEAKGLQASDITSAISNHISLKSAELAAQQGTKPVDTKVTPNAGAPKNGEMSFAAFKQLSDHDRCEFFRKGGKLNS